MVVDHPPATIEITMPDSGPTHAQRRAQLPEEVAVHVREKIMSGDVRYGDYLRLDLLAEELGISVTPVREALLTLRGEGFIELEPRQGFVVASLSRQDLGDIYRLQSWLAGELAARAASRIDAPGLTELESVHEQLAHAPHERTDGSESDGADGSASSPGFEQLVSRFHRTIHDAARSAKLAWFLDIAARYAPQRFAGAVHGWADACVTDHAVILSALREHSPAAAETAMREHIDRVGNLLITHLDAHGFWAETG